MRLGSGPLSGRDNRSQKPKPKRVSRAGLVSDKTKVTKAHPISVTSLAVNPTSKHPPSHTAKTFFEVKRWRFFSCTCSPFLWDLCSTNTCVPLMRHQEPLMGPNDEIHTTTTCQNVTTDKRRSLQKQTTLGVLFLKSTHLPVPLHDFNYSIIAPWFGYKSCHFKADQKARTGIVKKIISHFLRNSEASTDELSECRWPSWSKVSF